jgi:hypothetical protein
MTGTNENIVLEPTFPISAPEFALRTVNKAMPCGRSTNTGNRHVSCPDETTAAIGDVVTGLLSNSKAQTYRVLPSVAKPAPETVSTDPPVTGPDVGERESQLSKVKRKVEEEPDLNGTGCPPKTCTSSKVAERMELVHFGVKHTIVELDAGTTGAESKDETPEAENLH